MDAHFEKPVSTIAERLKQALELRNMTAAELSRRTNITTASISHYINGRYTPKQDKIYQLSQALNVNPSWLMGLDVSINEELTEERARLSTTYVPEKKLQERLLQEMKELCKQVQKSVISPGDRELLDKFHALAKDSQAIVMAMIEKLSPQESVIGYENDKKKEEAV